MEELTTSAAIPRFKDLKAKRTVRQRIIGALFIAYLGAGWMFPVLGYFIPLCMVLGLGIAKATGGRKWCDWLCLRGSFLDAYMGPVSRSGKIPDLLKSTGFRIGVLAFLLTVMTTQIIRLWPDPVKIGGFFMVLLTVTTVAGIIMAFTFHQRAWCMICPIGSMSNWLTRSHAHFTINSALCNDCGACGKVCPMQIAANDLNLPVASYRESSILKEWDERIRSHSPLQATGNALADGFKTSGIVPVYAGDCLQCNQCVSVCPKKALSVQPY